MISRTVSTMLLLVLVSACNTTPQSPVTTSVPATVTELSIAVTLQPTVIPVEAGERLILPNLQGTPVPIADYAEVGDRLDDCQMDIPYGRIGGGVAYEYRPYDGGEETLLAWAPMTDQFPHGVYITGIMLYSVPQARLDWICPLARKGMRHIDAADFIIQEAVRLSGRSYNELVWNNNVEGQANDPIVEAFTGLADYYALLFLSQTDQVTLVGQSKPQPTVITKSHITSAEELMQTIIESRNMSWWHTPEIWNQLPD